MTQDKDGLEKNLSKFKSEFAKLKNGMREHWARFKKDKDTHAYVNLFVEAERLSPYLLGHVNAVLWPAFAGVLVYLLVSASIAGTLTVNGKPCGDFTNMTIDTGLNVAVKSSLECGGTTPVPPTPPPAPACPVGVMCVEHAWPNSPQKLVRMNANQVMAFKIQTGASGTGRLITAYTTGDTATRLITFSDKPGVFETADRYCTVRGLEVANMLWQIGGTGRLCVLPANATVYINIKLTNCEAGKMCGFYMSSN